MPGVSLAALQGDLAKPGPGDWIQVGELQKLYIYPVKSAAGVPVDCFTTGPWAAENGPMVDRQFIILDNKGVMATARKWPNITLIEPKVEPGSLTLSYPGMESFTTTIPSEEKLQQAGQVFLKVFDDPCQGVDLGNEVGSWISEAVLGDPEAGMKLVFHPKGVSSRPDKPEDSVIFPTRKPEDKPFFADSFPYMMMSQPSITELNKLLEEEAVDLEVEEKRFRPNIFISGDFPAFAEDQWPWVRIGDKVVFRHSQPCDRCLFTTVDPFIGDKHPRGEPLKTLRKHRSTTDPGEKKVYGSAPLFGVALAVETLGNINVGDPVFVGKRG